MSVPWAARRSKQSVLKEINPEYSMGRIHAEAESPVLWPPDAKRPLCWERLKQKKKGVTQDEMVR